MSQARYENKCVVCNQPFVAKRKGSRYCSGACRARYSREKKEAKYQGVLKDQSEVIQSQSKVIQAALSEVLRPVVPEKRVRTYSKFANVVLIEQASVAYADTPSDIRQLSYKQVCDELTRILNETRKAAKADNINKGNAMLYMKDPDRFRQLCHWEIELSRNGKI